MFKFPNILSCNCTFTLAFQKFGLANAHPAHLAPPLNYEKGPYTKQFEAEIFN